MSEQPQVISDPSDLRKYRTELPNLADDDGLDVFEFRLLAHYKRVGECTESAETTSKKCRMSVGKVSDARQSLAEKQWIHLKRVPMDEGRYRFIVTVRDRWIENFAKYSGLSKDEITEQLKRASASLREGLPSRSEPSPSRGEGKNKPIKKLINSLVNEDFAKMTVQEAMRVPTLNLYYRATNFFPGSGVWALVDTFIRENDLTEESIKTASSAWQFRGFKRENVEGILQWARDGVPQNGKGAKHANGNSATSNSKSANRSAASPAYTSADRDAAERVRQRKAVAVP